MPTETVKLEPGDLALEVENLFQGHHIFIWRTFAVFKELRHLCLPASVHVRLHHFALRFL